MSDVNKVLSGQGNYGFEDKIAREKISDLEVLVNSISENVVDITNNSTFDKVHVYEVFDLNTLQWFTGKQLNSNGSESTNSKASVCLYLYSPKGSYFSIEDGYMFNIATYSNPVTTSKTDYRTFSSEKYMVSNDCYVKISVVNSDNTTPVTADIAKSVISGFVYSETKAEKYKNEVHSISNLDIPLENGTLSTRGVPEDAVNRVRSSKGVYIKVNTVLRNLNSVSINWRSYKDEECTQFYSAGGNFTTGDITIGKSNYYKFVIQKNNYANGSLSQYLSIDNNNIQQDHETRISNLEFATQPLRGMPIIFAPSSPYHYTGSSITESIINGSGNLLTPLYALYDDLEAAYPNNITKEVLGYDQSGLHEIRAYTIQQHKAPISKPVVLWISGVHGSETYTHTATYMFVKELLENNQNDDVLGFIWRNCIFKVIPIANPWGLANGASRYNSRGVNLNRNFNADWEFSDEQYNASGEAPESEAETQAIVNFVNANKNAIFAVNKHDSGTLASENGRIAYSVDDFRIDLTIMRALYSQLQVSMLKNYPWLATNRPASAYTLMFSSLSTASDHGTMDKWFSTIGVHGCLLEVSRPASDDYTANKKQDFIKMNLETSVNMISAMIEKNQLMASNDALWYEYTVIE